MAAPAALIAAIPSIIAGGSALAGAAGNWITGRRNAKRAQEMSKYNTDQTILANKELAQYAYAEDQRMWQQQNQFNHPAQQMARLKEAGLNPHLVYGTGTVTGNTQGGTPEYNAPKVDYNYQPFQSPNPELGQFTNTMLQAAQVDNVRANTKLAESKTISEGINAGILSHEEARRQTAAMQEAGMAHSKIETAAYQMEIKKNEALASKELPQKASIERQRNDLQRQLEAMRYQFEKEGLTPNDKLWLRILTKTLPSFGLDPIKILGKQLYNLIK